MTPEEQKQLDEAVFNVVLWKQIAAYIAHCEIATAEVLFSKESTSANEKKRQMDIVHTCLNLLSNSQTPRQFGSGESYANDKVADAVGRASSFIEYHKGE
jgi:hypothetical protein